MRITAGTPAGTVRVERVLLAQRNRPLDLRGIAVRHLGLERCARLRKEVERAPITELGHGGRGHRPHERSKVASARRDAIEVAQELESLPLEALTTHGLLGLIGPPGRVELEQLARA